jgi:magnesium chelatase family protein
MIAKVKSSTIFGIEGLPVEVEVETGRGTPARFNIIGLGDNAVREARDRVTAALKSSGFAVPTRVLVNLAPAEVKKEGSSFDLAIALGILISSGQLRAAKVSALSFYAELSLDGQLKPVQGVTSFAISALQRGEQGIIVPIANLKEARLLSGLNVLAFSHLLEVVAFLSGQVPNTTKEHETAQESLAPEQAESKSMGEVVGQDFAKRALTIAAAGGHNLLMIGPPGCGKSMLAERLPSILPPLSESEMLELARIYGVSGLSIDKILKAIRPFREPHHVISEAGLIGGGSYPRPGEVSFAHRGILFLDEFVEFKRSVVEALRSPLEMGRVTITRAKASFKFPAKFQLIAAMNPCPCGRLGSGMSAQCNCSAGAITTYLAKLSEPILDRIDLHVELRAVSIKEIYSNKTSSLEEADCKLREQVVKARKVQLDRHPKLNSELGPRELKKVAPIDDKCQSLIQMAAVKQGLSARAYNRIIKVSRTIADLDGSQNIKAPHLAEALSYRNLDRLRDRYKAT